MMNRFYNNGFNGFNGFNGNGFCRGYNLFHNGGSILIGIGVLVIIALLFYLFVHNNKKRVASAAAESLKLKYIQGEITEEEYFRRKSIIDR